MRKRIIGVLGFAAVAIAIAAPLQAQGRRGGGPSLDDQMTTLTEQLELTDEQSVEVRKILEAQGLKRREMFEAGGGDRGAMRAAMGEIQEETAAMLGDVLNEDQMAEYAKIQEERQQRRGPPPID